MWGSNFGPPNSDPRLSISFLSLAATSSGGTAQTEYTCFSGSTCWEVAMRSNIKVEVLEEEEEEEVGFDANKEETDLLVFSETETEN
ncbi:hypothetical protein CFP56_039069 [Quercus suber]|uniref:Uncharacterized protein n=1 Tax=Quercus suber TaxID=58331 RepID=A0AAW0LMY2_QUESU